MMTQGGDLLHSRLGYEKEGLVRAFSNKSGAQTARKRTRPLLGG